MSSPRSSSKLVARAGLVAALIASAHLVAPSGAALAVDGTPAAAPIGPHVSVLQSCSGAAGSVDVVIVNVHPESARYRVEVQDSSQASTPISRVRRVPGLDLRKVSMVVPGDASQNYDVLVTRDDVEVHRQAIRPACGSGAAPEAPEASVVSACRGGRGLIRALYVNPGGDAQRWSARLTSVTDPVRRVRQRNRWVGAFASQGLSFGRQPDGVYQLDVYRGRQPIRTFYVEVDCANPSWDLQPEQLRVLEIGFVPPTAANQNLVDQSTALEYWDEQLVDQLSAKITGDTDQLAAMLESGSQSNNGFGVQGVDVTFVDRVELRQRPPAGEQFVLKRLAMEIDPADPRVDADHPSALDRSRLVCGGGVIPPEYSYDHLDNPDEFVDVDGSEDGPIYVDGPDGPGMTHPNPPPVATEDPDDPLMNETDEPQVAREDPNDPLQHETDEPWVVDDGTDNPLMTEGDQPEVVIEDPNDPLQHETDEPWVIDDGTDNPLMTKGEGVIVPEGRCVYLSEVSRPDYPAILESLLMAQPASEFSGAGESFCGYIEREQIDQVWIWTDHDLEVEPAEAVMSPRNGVTFGVANEDIELNGERLFPQCDKTYTAFNFNYRRSVSAHTFIHAIEGLMSWHGDKYSSVDRPIFGWDDAAGRPTDHTFGAECGDAHWAPNVPRRPSEGHLSEYLVTITTEAPSECFGWNPASTGDSAGSGSIADRLVHSPDTKLATTTWVSCQTWDGCHAGFDNPYSESGPMLGNTDEVVRNYEVWWLRQLPGLGFEHLAQYDGEVYRVNSPWSIMADPDRFLPDGASPSTMRDGGSLMLANVP